MVRMRRIPSERDLEPLADLRYKPFYSRIPFGAFAAPVGVIGLFHWGLSAKSSLWHV